MADYHLGEIESIFADIIWSNAPLTSRLLAELAEQYKGKIIIYKINVDKEKELAGAFGIQSIPSILFIPKEGKPSMSLGAMSKDDFIKSIENLLLKK